MIYNVCVWPKTVLGESVKILKSRNKIQDLKQNFMFNVTTDHSLLLLFQNNAYKNTETCGLISIKIVILKFYISLLNSDKCILNQECKFNEIIYQFFVTVY